MKKVSLLLAAACAAFSSVFGLETAEALIVKIDMSNLSTSTDGAYIGTWANQATGELAASDFAPCTDGKGPVYVANAGGRPGVYFNGSADSTMESPSDLPSTIISNDTWSAEAWVYTPTRLASKTYFTWTRRGGGNQLVELRYGNDNGNAIEHHSNNVGWGGLPVEGNWHYVAITRDGAGYENLYLDGIRVSGKDAYTALNIRNNGHFTLGGTKADNGNFDGGLLYTGYVGAIRVHAGTLSAAQVKANYLEECGDYRAVWSGGDDSWSNASAWGMGAVPGSNADVSFVNGGTATVDTADVAVKWVNLWDGTIVVDNGRSFAINAESNINLAKGSNATNGTFVLRNGTFSPNRRVDGAELGATLDMVIGEHGAADGTAVAVFPNEFHLAVNGTGRLVIEDGADVTVKGWFSAARYNSSAVGTITMNGGLLTSTDWFLIACNKGRGEFVMNGGHAIINRVEFTHGDNDANQYGRLYLNGGIFEYNYTQNNNTTGHQAIYFNGGTIRARSTNTNFIIDKFDLVEVRAGGAFIDVPGVFAVDVASPFTESSDSPGGSIVKTGTGRLNFKDNFAYAGTIELRDGVTKFTKKSNLAGATLKVEKGAAVMCTEDGGMAELLSHITADSEGTILISNSNLSDNVDLSGHPKLQVGFFGTSGEYTGTITYYPGTAQVLSFNTLSGSCDINNTLADIGGEPTALHLVGTPGTAGKLVLKKDSTFTGGIVVDAAMLQFDTALGMGTTGPIRLVNGGELVLNHANIDVQAVIDRITADSDGALVFCNNSKKDVNFSLVGHPGLYVGAYLGHNFDYTGTITPDDPNEYHFGGGHAEYTQNDGGFKYKPSASSVADADGQPTTVVFGKPGIASLMATHGYTGGTVITNGATVFFHNNEAAYGALPATHDPDNFYFDGGNARIGGMTMALSATRGVTVGPNGAKFHVWGNQTFTIKGSLHGTGPILVSDSGTLVFAGEANDFSGTLATSSAAIQIGDDEHFNWDFDTVMPEITGTGRLIIGVPAGTTYTFDKSAGSGSGWFGKAGTGTLVLTAQQQLPSTSIKAGTLVVECDDGIGNGTLDMAKGTTLEIRNNSTIHVNSLSGAGTITAPDGTTATLVIGVSNGGDTFMGTISQNVRVVKEGTGSQTLYLENDIDVITVNGGTLYLFVPSAVGRPVVADGATLVFMSNDKKGILGRYYTSDEVNAAIGGSGTAWKNAINSHETLLAVWNAATSETVEQYTGEFGASLDVRTNNTGNFPDPYRTRDYWVAVWRGYFLAETDGEYEFASASDDGTALYIDGQKIVSNIADQGYNTNQFDAHKGTVALTRGWHLIDLGFYDNTGGNEMTFRVTVPGGEAQAIPNSLLAETTVTPVSIGDTSGIQGVVLLEDTVKFVYDVADGATVDNPPVVTPESDFAELAKDGKGTLVWSDRGEGASGTFHVMDGTLALREATAVGSLVIEEPATVTVSPKKNADYRGLSLRYYDSTDNTYNEVAELGRMHTFFEETLTPTIVTNSYVFGSSTFTTDGNPAYREPGKYSTGTDNYYVYATGQLYLPYDGQYAFGFYSDDGIALYIDGTRHYHHGGTCGSANGNNSGWITLASGYHTYEWAFRENGGGQYFYVYLKAKDASGNAFDKWEDWTYLPQELLYPEFSRVSGLSGAGTLDLGRGMLRVDQDVDSVFSGTVAASSGEGECVTAYLVKTGSGKLELTGAVAANVVASEGVVALEPADVAAYADIVAESCATVAVNAASAVSIGRLRGKGVLRIDGGATVTADADGFEGTVLVVNGKFLATATADDATMCKYTVVTEPSENATAVAGVAGTPSGNTLPYTDLYATGVAAEVAGVRAVVADASSLTIGDSSDVTLVALERQETDDYGLWQFNSKAEEWVGLDGEKDFLVLPGGGNWVGSVYLKEKINVTRPWRMTWTYVATKGAGNQWGDGAAFVIQNDPAGASFCDTGCTGGKLGGPCSTDHPLSAAFWWNLYQKESCGWAQKGVKGTETTLLNNPSNEARHTLQGYDLDIAYNGAGVMSCRIFYQGKEVHATTQDIDMADVIGGNDENWDGTAYVGFSAATGGSGAFMKVMNVAWYTAKDASSPEPGTDILVAEDATAALCGMTADETFGALALEEDAALTLKANNMVPANDDYSVTVSELRAVGGVSSLALADNGTGKGTLNIGQLVYDGGAVRLSGGNLTTTGNTLNIVVTNPDFEGSAAVVMFADGASWTGAVPELAVVDEEGNPLKIRASITASRIRIASGMGVSIIVR